MHTTISARETLFTNRRFVLSVNTPHTLCLLADTAVGDLASKTPTEPQKEGSCTDTDGSSTDQSEVSGKVSKGGSDGSSHSYTSPIVTSHGIAKHFVKGILR